jgi:hypothetical protein
MSGIEHVAMCATKLSAFRSLLQALEIGLKESKRVCQDWRNLSESLIAI